MQWIQSSPSSGPKDAGIGTDLKAKQQEEMKRMKLKTMENALDTYPNRFQLTMMAVARAKEINDGEASLASVEDQAKPVVLALKEIAEGMVVPATHNEMSKIREAKRILRERVLMEAEDVDLQTDEDGDDSYASAHPKGDSVES
jgi:DNA-directed RNA polymerase omega subunit